MQSSVDNIVIRSANLLNLPLCGLNSKQVCDSSKVTDHHAILPTESVENIDLEELPAGEREILLMIAKRLLCAVSEPYVCAETFLTLECGGTEFTAKGRTVQSLGWKSYLDGGESPLPELSEGMCLPILDASVQTGKTSPPKHHTEDTLLSAMDHIGTPATRAGILEKLVACGFVERKKQKKHVSLVPTHSGISLVTVLPEQLQSPLLTAEWEERLQQIERGEASPEAFLEDITEMLEQLVGQYHAIEGAEVLFPSGRTVIGRCPRCGGDVTESKKGYFCESNECRFALWRDNKYLEAKRITLNRKMAKELLEYGRTFVSGIFSERTGRTYDAFLTMTDDGTRTTYRITFEQEIPA